MKNLLTTFFLVIIGNLMMAQAGQDDIQAEMDRVKEQVKEQMALFQELMQESFNEDFFQTMPFRDTMIYKEFNFGDGMGEIDKEEMQHLMRDMQEQIRMQFEQLNMEEFFREGFGGPAIPAPEELEPRNEDLQNQDGEPRRKRRKTHSL